MNTLREGAVGFFFCFSIMELGHSEPYQKDDLNEDES